MYMYTSRFAASSSGFAFILRYMASPYDYIYIMNDYKKLNAKNPLKKKKVFLEKPDPEFNFFVPKTYP